MLNEAFIAVHSGEPLWLMGLWFVVVEKKLLTFIHNTIENLHIIKRFKFHVSSRSTFIYLSKIESLNCI